MRFMVTIPNSNNPEHMARCMQHVMHGVAELNCYLLKQQPLPALAESGVQYQPEPFNRNLQFDELPDCITIADRGFADCAPLCCWRLAELWNAGERDANIIIYWRNVQEKQGHAVRTMHAQVRRADGTREDPSRLYGMVGKTSD